MKHVEVRQLWIQEKVREGRTGVCWIFRYRNSADALTRPCTGARMKEPFFPNWSGGAVCARSARGGCWRSHHADIMSGGRSLDFGTLV